jgi:hypothetical protein
VARLALQTGAPVFPIGQWGAQRLIAAPRAPRARPRPRTPVLAIVGDPVDLSRWHDVEVTAEVLDEVTATIMAAVTACVGEVRGEPVPDRPPHDPRSSEPE